jgi:uncharacterized membrane protein YgdD (TMEM256/DUF423 family)
MNPRTTLIAAAILGASGVGLGAFGAHGLRAELLASGMTNAWETAVRYHLLHAVVLFALAVSLRQSAGPSRAVRLAGWGWLIGVIVFSGSLYWLALGGPRWLGPITPLGGIALLGGWLALIPAALTDSSGGTGVPPVKE